MNLREKLQKAWAKSDGTTIREHTDQLLENLRRLKELYGDSIEKACPEEFREHLWRALELACEYHDYGKLHCKFQREVLRNKNYEDKRTIERVRHNLLSPAFIEEDLESPLKELVALAIIHHHDTETGEEVVQKVEKVLREEFGLQMPPWLKRLIRRQEYEALQTLAKDKEKMLSFYVLLKGLLLRIDHSSSNLRIETIEKDPTKEIAQKIKEKKGFELNDLQSWVSENRDKSLMVIAPTGYGKTEAGFLFLEGKGFYTIPVRTSANAIYLRARELFEDSAGLLHSTAMSFLLEEEGRNGIEGLVVDYEYARNFSKPLLVCTPDQLFPFVFAHKGFEKTLALLSYSRVVVDELQLFEPHTLGFLVEGLKVAMEMGSKVMVMTATLPEFVRRELPLEERIFDLPIQRHRVEVIESSLLSDSALCMIERLQEKGSLLVITNTVKRAVEVYTKLKDMGLRPGLLHSRYILKERKYREKEIKEFYESKEKGIWITTQLAEVSLDLDADYLLTELSTLDSLFQRMGRVNRKGRKPIEETNVFVFVQDCSGVPQVYRKGLHNFSRGLLKDGLYTEEEKREMVSLLYSEETLKSVEPKFFENYSRAKSYIRDLWQLLSLRQESRRTAQKIFRDIHSVAVIPQAFKEVLKEPLRALRESSDPIERIRSINHILDYTFSIPSYTASQKLERVQELRAFEIYWLRMEYSQELGLYHLSGDPELEENIL